MLLKLLDNTLFRRNAGHCWTVSLPQEIGTGDSPERSVSRLVLFEGERSLGPSHSVHDDIRGAGLGAYSHWGTELWFSTSDNSNPTRNGRRYSVVAFESAEADNHLNTDAPTRARPVNWQPRTLDLESIESDAHYALAVATSYVQGLPDGMASISGRSFLELGPGQNLGSALALLCLGAGSVTVADRFVPSFDAEYHAPLYRRLAELLAEQYPGIGLSPLKNCSGGGTHEVIGLSVFAVPLEHLAEHVAHEFDITASNAVLEHLFNPRRAIESLFVLTAPGGLGMHQVDFRDHRTFDRPLEFLLEDERSFASIFEQTNGEIGNRVRPYQMESMFRQAGFSDIKFHCNMEADSDYLREFVQVLRCTATSTFQPVDAEKLRPISGRFVLAK